MNKNMCIFTIAAVAVVVVLLGSWIATNNSGPDDFDPVGDWTMIEETKGYYIDGVPKYRQSNEEARISIEKCADEYSYIMTGDGYRSVWVRDGDLMTTGNLFGDEGGLYASLTIEEGVMRISYVTSICAVVKTFVREGSSVSEVPAYCPFPSFIKEGLILDGAVAMQILDDEDLTGDNYKFNVDRVESDMFFYRITSDVAEPMEFVCINYGNGMCIASSPYDDSQYVVDMIRPVDGLVYAVSFDRFDESISFWYAVYGDGSKIEHIDAELKETTYKGMQHATIMKDDEFIALDEETAISLYYIIQDNGVVNISTMTADNDWSDWGGLVYKKSDGYGIMIMSLASYDGDRGYHGIYNCTLAEDLKTMTVNGSAGYYHTSVAFIQELEKYGF